MLCFMILSLCFSYCFGSFVDFFFFLLSCCHCVSFKTACRTLLILHFILRQSQNNVTGDNETGWFSLCISLFSRTCILLVDTSFWKSCYQFKLMSENTKFRTILQAACFLLKSSLFPTYWRYYTGSYCYVIDWGGGRSEDGWNLQIRLL